MATALDRYHQLRNVKTKNDDLGSKLAGRISNLETRLSAAGQEVPEPEQKSNLLLKALDILDRPRNAILSGLTGKGFVKGLTGETDVHTTDVLKDYIKNPYLRGAAGFVGDVLLDPLTYLTVGAGAAAKGATAGARMLKFAGLPIADVTPVAKGLGKVVQATRVPEVLGPVFSNRYIRRAVTSAEEMPDIEKARDIIMGVQRAIPGRQQEALGGLAKTFEGITPETATEASRIIEAPTVLRNMLTRRKTGTLKPLTALDETILKQTGTARTPEMIKSAYKLGLKPSQEGIEVARLAKQVTAETATTDIAAGVTFNQVPNYVRHLYKDPPERVQQVYNAWLRKRLAMPGKKAGFQKERLIPTIAEAKQMGLTPIEDVRVLTAVREMEGIKQRAINGMYGNLHKLENVVVDAKKAPAGWKTYPNIAQLEGKAVHPEIGRFLERFNSTVNTDEGMRTLATYLNNVQNIWKGFVTAPNLFFHIRNEVGNVFNNFLAGVVNPGVYRLARIAQKGGNEVLELGGKQYTANQLRQIFREQGLEGFGFFHGESPKGMIRQATEAFEPSKNFAQKIKYGVSHPVQVGRDVGNFIETNSKMAHFIDRLNKGDNIEQAAESARKYLFDYGDLTVTEKKIRNFLPFYTWTRKNIPLQLEHLITQPGKMTAVNKLIQNLPHSDDLPDWMKSELAIPIGNNRHLMLDLPETQLNMLGGGETLRNMLSMITPFAKIPIELAMGQQVFSGAPIEKYPGATAQYGNLRLPAKLAYAASQFGGVPRTAADIIGATREQQPPEGNIPAAPAKTPVISQLIRSINPERERILKQYERERQLKDFVRYLKEVKDQEIPTMTELKKKKKRGYFY